MFYSISIVIPNYNGRHLLGKNIPFLINALDTSKITDYEIIITDDNSDDDSVSFIRDAYPEIILLCNEQNRGFSGNTNIGIQAVTKDLVFILNSDVQLTERYFDSLLPLFDIPDTFGVMGKIIGIDSDKIQDGAKYPSYSFGSIKGTKNYVSRTDSILLSFFLSGANALIDRKKLLLLGGFREIFNPYYWEDLDLGIRAWRMGYKIYYANSAVCRHPIAATIRNEPENKLQIVNNRNKLYLHFLHLNGVELYYFLFKMLLKSTGRLILGNICYIQSMYLFINSLPALRISKNEFKQLQSQAFSNLTVNDIAKNIKNSIHHSEITKF